MHLLKIFLIALIATSLLACSGKQHDPTAKWSAAKFYKKAKAQADSNNYEQAIDFYESLESRFPFSQYATQAQLDVAYAYYKYDEPDSAIAALDRFLKLNPRHKGVEYAYYLKGVANFDRGSSFLDKFFSRDLANYDQVSVKAAYSAFSILLERFPNSIYTADARQRMVYLRNKMAESELSTAQYYFDRKAYVAVANRTQEIIKKYQGTPSTLVALQLLKKSYVGLGLDDLAMDTQRVIEASYTE
ncbi:MAG: outer membrane protein assembly factor BamD [Gammaproteobacteria bacterium]|nr:outer membrane protein assembly factor BamD [Gammaproteobacteria bacterium]